MKLFQQSFMVRLGLAVVILVVYFGGRQLLSRTYEVSVSANAPWVNSGITVKSGQKYKFISTGEWGESPGVSRGADGGSAGMFGSGYWGVERRVPSAQWGALVGRVGATKFLIGQTATISMPEDGELMLGINDGDGELGDNHGVLVVKIQSVW